MARGTKPKNAAPAESPAPKPKLNPQQMWLHEAWHGWMKSILPIVLLGVGYVAYSQRWLGDRTEGVLGVLLVVAIVGGTIALTVAPAYGLFQGAKRQWPFIAFVAVWAIATGYPALQITWPKPVLKEITLGEPKDHLSETIDLADQLHPGEKGPFELAVSGSLKGSGEVEANYRITVTGDDKSSSEITGSVKRTIVRQRVSRKGTGTTAVRQEHTENVHRLTEVRGTKLQLAMESVDDQLEHGVHVAVERAGVDPTWFLVVAGLCALLGLILDYRLAGPKVKTYFAMATGMTAVFAYYYPMEARPHFLVPSAISSLVVATITGGFGGALLAWIGRSVKPKPKLRKS